MTNRTETASSTKSNKIIYWIATIWLLLGMLSTGIVQLLKVQTEIDNITQLGYPGYLLPILGIWKILGVVAVLTPKASLLKEWAYAGFFFAMSGAIFSHIALGNSILKIFPSLLLLILTILSWYFSPAKKNSIVIFNKVVI